MKIATVGAALERGVVTPDTKIQVPPVLRVGDADFKDAEDHGTVNWTHDRGAGPFVEHRHDQDRAAARQAAVVRHASGLRLRCEDGLGFPNELGGVVPDPNDPSQWWSTSIGTVPIGQGVAVTPLQMLLAYNVDRQRGDIRRAAIGALDGRCRRQRAPRCDRQRTPGLLAVDVGQAEPDAPRCGRGGHGEERGRRRIHPGRQDRYVAQGAARRWVRQDQYGVTKYQSTFVGFVPAEQPALSIIVIMDEPGGQYTGGAVAAPAWSKIASFALQHEGVAPPLTDAPAGGVSAAAAQIAGGKVRGLPAEQAPPPPIPDTTEPTSSSTSTTQPKKLDQ